MTRWRLLATAAALLVASAARGAATLEEDARTALLVAGHRCPAVARVERLSGTVMRVACSDGSLYRIDVLAGERIAIALLAGPVPPHAARDRDSHDAHVGRSLYSIVTVLGHDCDEVIAYERVHRRHHVVTCRDGTRYRVQVTPEGRVTAEPG